MPTTLENLDRTGHILRRSSDSLELTEDGIKCLHELATTRGIRVVVKDLPTRTHQAPVALSQIQPRSRRTEPPGCRQTSATEQKMEMQHMKI